MRVKKEIERTRRIIVEVDSGDAVWSAGIGDHMDSAQPEKDVSGSSVTVSRRKAKSGVDNALSFHVGVADWPAVKQAVDRAIEEFRREYPESPR